MKSAFHSLGITDVWIQCLQKMAIETPTAIQEIAIPELLKQSNAIIRSQTGTGKTLAYLLPIVEMLDAQLQHAQAIILAPTAELAMQIVRVATALTEGSPLIVQGLIGGASLQRQIDHLKKHPQLIIGTPGRIMECIHLRKLRLTHIRHLIVDEADQIFHLGTNNDALNIIRNTPQLKQIIFCSATISEHSETLIQQFTKTYTRIVAEDNTEGVLIPQTINHEFIIQEDRDRLDILRKLIRVISPRSAMIFVNHTDVIGGLLAKLQYHGVPVEAIYGDQPKQERVNAIRKFREGKLQLLLATDLAARGIDASDITHVIHYEPPLDATSYLHRVGRTGRMGRLGTSILFIRPDQAFIVKKLVSALHIEFTEKTLQGDKLTNIIRSQNSSQAIQSPSKAPKASKAPLPRPKSPAPQPKKKSNQKHDSKSKGAPRWLKAKQQITSQPLDS
jgi:ATP-dependent RNA helicase DeaD